MCRCYCCPEPTLTCSRVRSPGCAQVPYAGGDVFCTLAQRKGVGGAPGVAVMFILDRHPTALRSAHVARKFSYGKLALANVCGGTPCRADADAVVASTVSLPELTREEFAAWCVWGSGARLGGEGACTACERPTHPPPSHAHAATCGRWLCCTLSLNA